MFHKDVPFFLAFCVISLTLPALVDPAEMPTPQAVTLPIAISDVAVSRKVFNPNAGEAVAISYRISKPAKISLKIFDPDRRLVREIMAEDIGPADRHDIVWDGKDTQGRTVPDEAYFFTLEANDLQGHVGFYDPATFSGGDAFHPENVQFDKEKSCISYQLSRDARVTIKAGISAGGPLLKNVLSGMPKGTGDHCAESGRPGSDGNYQCRQPDQLRPEHRSDQSF